MNGMIAGVGQRRCIRRRIVLIDEGIRTARDIQIHLGQDGTINRHIRVAAIRPRAEAQADILAVIGQAGKISGGIRVVIVPTIGICACYRYPCRRVHIANTRIVIIIDRRATACNGRDIYHKAVHVDLACAGWVIDGDGVGAIGHRPGLDLRLQQRGNTPVHARHVNEHVS